MLRCFSLVAAVALPLLVGCTQLAEQRQMRARERAVRDDLASFSQALHSAASARIVVERIETRYVRGAKRVFNLSAAEFSSLCDILSRSRALPVSPREPVSRPVAWAAYFRLELLDSSGRVLASRDPSVTWTSQTRMLNLPVDYQSTIYDPTWYLPDADFLALARLPSMRAADKWMRGMK